PPAFGRSPPVPRGPLPRRAAVDARDRRAAARCGDGPSRHVLAVPRASPYAHTPRSHERSNGIYPLLSVTGPAGPDNPRRNMGHINRTAVAKVPVGTGFAYVDDYRNVPGWMFGVTRFEPVGNQNQGLGATFDTTMQLGPKALHSRVRITEWEQDRLIRLES